MPYNKNNHPTGDEPTDEIPVFEPTTQEFPAITPDEPVVHDEPVNHTRRNILRGMLGAASLIAIGGVASQLLPERRATPNAPAATPEQPQPAPLEREQTESYMSTEKFGSQYMGSLVTAMQAKGDRVAMASTIAKEHGKRLTPGDDPVLWGNHLGLDDTKVEPDTLPYDPMTNRAYRYIEFHSNGRGFATWMGTVGRSTQMRVSFTYEPLPDGKLPTDEDLLHTVGPSLQIDSLTWATISDDGKERESGSFETIPNGGPNREDDAQISLNDQQITDPAKRAEEYSRVEVLIAELQLASQS